MDHRASATPFRNGRRRTARLPCTAKPSPWDDFFDAGLASAKGFLARCSDRTPQKRTLFAGDEQ